jgi:hypothetical protein
MSTYERRIRSSFAGGAEAKAVCEHRGRFLQYAVASRPLTCALANGGLPPHWHRGFTSRSRLRTD